EILRTRRAPELLRPNGREPPLVAIREVGHVPHCRRLASAGLGDSPGPSDHGKDFAARRTPRASETAGAGPDARGARVEDGPGRGAGATVPVGRAPTGPVRQPRESRIPRPLPH